jgi:hypothetical protein
VGAQHLCAVRAAATPGACAAPSISLLPFVAVVRARAQARSDSCPAADRSADRSADCGVGCTNQVLQAHFGSLLSLCTDLRSRFDVRMQMQKTDLRW